MTEDTALVLLALCYLAVKHTVADFFLQFPYQYKNKGNYGHPGGLVHALIHAVLTVPVFVILTPRSLLVAALVCAAEFVVHYHVDWAKEQVVSRRGLASHMREYWYTVGVDQLCHQLTYLAIVTYLAMNGLSR